MVKIQNNELLQELKEITHELNDMLLPREIAKDIQPVIILKQHKTWDFRGSFTASSGADLTLFTTPTDRDFYIVGYHVTINKNAACDHATDGDAVKLNMTPRNQATRTILEVPLITLQAARIDLLYTFEQPVLLARGSTITLDTAPTHTAGVFQRNARMWGYSVIVPKRN